MTVTELFNIIKRAKEDIFCDGKKIASHDISSSVSVVDDEYNIYTIDSFHIEGLPGCGCPCDLIINIKREDNDGE